MNLLNSLINRMKSEPHDYWDEFHAGRANLKFIGEENSYIRDEEGVESINNEIIDSDEQRAEKESTRLEKR
jgi:hypothetical protein